MPENKDPAVLFYTADFLVGVQGLTMEERGQYITLLCLQHQQGHLSQKTISLAVGTVSSDVLSKFEVDENGLLYHHRMDAEAIKRENYVHSRQENGKKGGRPSKPKENHMVNLKETYDKPYDKPYGKPKENLPENDNENINKDIIHYLNTKLGTKYKASAEYVKKHINARLNEGYTLEDFKTVIDKKYKEWNGTEFAKFLRPETLFGTKFSTYLNQLGAEVQEARYTSFSADDALERALQRAYKED
jgi:uncharacterized phage protein (TIGR02220 family)